MKAATRGSQHQHDQQQRDDVRVRPLILSNRNTASSTPTISEPATVTTSHIADTCGIDETAVAEQADEIGKTDVIAVAVAQHAVFAGPG